ncbi:MAG: hypothetical protein PHX27_03820 [Candidatus ainarchaeum sp.]|nr:hypothetical protein [Candidatus ainarchaeum sp.]
MVDFLNWLKINKGKVALNESRSKKEKMLNARRQADEAKRIIFLHQKTHPDYYKRVAVRKED